MKLHVVFIILLLAGLALISACNDEPSSLGIEILESDYIEVKTFNSQTDSIGQNSSYFKRIVSLGSSDRILIGKNQTTNQTITSSALMKFIFGFPDSIVTDIENDSLTVLDSWVVLTNKYLFGDSLDLMEFTTHEITAFWPPNTFTIDDLPSLQYDPQNIGTDLTTSDTLYTFHIDDNQLVYSWMQNSIDTNTVKNYGIYLEPTSNSNKIIGFQALTFLSSDAAKINVVIEKPGSYVDTIQGFVQVDISAVAGTEPVLTQGLTCVQSSVTFNSKLKFLVGVLPVGLVINKANLILTADSANSAFGSSFTNSLRAYILASNDSLDTEGNAITLAYSNNEYSGDITNFVRTWISKNENYGMLIQPANLILGTEFFALKGSDYPDVNLRPRVVITYTVKKNL